jgi:hypothetical protein
MAVNWQANPVTLPVDMEGYRLVAGSHPTVQTSMFADIDQHGPYIGYDGAICAAFGPLALFYVLWHEIGHHYHQHMTTPLVSISDFHQKQDMRGREIQADIYAASQLVTKYPNEAPAIFTAAHDYFIRNNSDGGGIHPPDRERATIMKMQWDALVAVRRCNVVFADDNNVPGAFAKTALGAFGIDVFHQDSVIQQIEAHKATVLTGPNGNGYAYGQAMRLIEQLKTTAKFSNSPQLALSIVMR